MSESINLNLEFNQIDEDLAGDYAELLQRLSVDIIAFRTSTGTIENDAQLGVASVIVNGAVQSMYDVSSDSADTATITYSKTDESSGLEQLSYIDGALWHKRHEESVKVLPTLEGIRLAVAMSLALTAALGPDNTPF
jgi:hypothetical protein